MHTIVDPTNLVRGGPLAPSHTRTRQSGKIHCPSSQKKRSSFETNWPSCRRTLNRGLQSLARRTQFRSHSPNNCYMQVRANSELCSLALDIKFGHQRARQLLQEGRAHFHGHRRLPLRQVQEESEEILTHTHARTHTHTHTHYSYMSTCA